MQISKSGVKDAVISGAQITLAHVTTLPNEIPMAGFNTPAAVVQMPIADKQMMIVFSYSGRKIVKTVKCRGEYKKYADKRTDILYSPKYDVVMLIGL